MFDWLKKIIKPKVTPMNKIVINSKNILNNLKNLEDTNWNQNIFPVLKSNAYGHGLKEISKIFDKSNVKYLCVDSFPEYQIVHNFTRKNILLIGQTLEQNYKYFDFTRTAFAVYNTNTIRELAKFKQKIKIHLFLNTGMNREWIQKENLNNILEMIKSCKNIEIEWVMSHLHSADDLENDSFEIQIQKFKEMFSIVEKMWFQVKYKHIANSAWIFRIEDNFFNSARVGLALYWYNPFEDKKHKSLKYLDNLKRLKPALEVYSKIISIQILSKWEGVSYNHKYIAKEKETIATIPFGYMEWLPRSASWKIHFSCRWKYYQQIGNICMNLCSMKIDDGLEIWDDIQIIWIEWKNTIQNLSDSANCINYEGLVGLDSKVARKIS